MTKKPRFCCKELEEHFNIEWKPWNLNQDGKSWYVCCSDEQGTGFIDNVRFCPWCGTKIVIENG